METHEHDDRPTLVPVDPAPPEAACGRPKVAGAATNSDADTEPPPVPPETETIEDPQRAGAGVSSGDGGLSSMTKRSAEHWADELAAYEEAVVGAALFDSLADEASALLKKRRYRGRLTRPMFRDLRPVLSKPTPSRYIQHVPWMPAKPYVSTGLRSLQYQIDYMNAVLGRAHWRELRHYPAEDRGHLVKVIVVVGNDLHLADIDAQGNLVPNEAEVIAMQAEWGSVTNASSLGDARKGSATNALKRAFASFGPGADVFRREFSEEAIGGTGPLRAPAAAEASHQAPTDRAVDPNRATAGMCEVIRIKASAAQLQPDQLANLVRRLAGEQPLAFDDVAAAESYLTRLLARLPRRLVDPIIEAIHAASAGQSSGDGGSGGAVSRPSTHGLQAAA